MPSARSSGEESLRYALLVLCLGYAWAAWHLWRGSRSVTHDIETVPAEFNQTTIGGARMPHVVSEFTLKWEGRDAN